MKDRQNEMQNRPAIDVSQFVSPVNDIIVDELEDSDDDLKKQEDFDGKRFRLSLNFPKESVERKCLIVDKILGRGSVPCGRGPDVRCSKYVVWDAVVDSTTQDFCRAHREQQGASKLSSKKGDDDDL